MQSFNSNSFPIVMKSFRNRNAGFHMYWIKCGHFVYVMLVQVEKGQDHSREILLGLLFKDFFTTTTKCL